MLESFTTGSSQLISFNLITFVADICFLLEIV